MRVYLQKKVLFGFVSAMLIITGLSVYSYVNNKKYKETSRWVAHANGVLYHAQQLLTVMVQLESAQQGYVITGNETFLRTYSETSREIDEHINNLRNLTADNLQQQQRISYLKDVIVRQLAAMDAGIKAQKTNHEEARKLISTLEEKTLMDEVRRNIEAVEQDEKKILKERSTMNEEEILRFNQAFFSLLITTAIILVLVFIFLHINLKGRVLAEESLRNASAQVKDMYDNAPCGYHSLDRNGIFEQVNQTWLRWLRYDRHEVVGKLKFQDVVTPDGVDKFLHVFAEVQKKGFSNDHEFEMLRKDGTTFPVLLNATAIYDEDGKFSKTRTTIFDYTDRKRSSDKINQLNRELEAFTYSVSHDLRAPLRSIDGYARILLEDYAGNLDDEGKRILNVVVNNARKMGQLIDDLLDFSRVGRKEIIKMKLNMDALVRSTLTELTDLEEGRLIESHIKELESCEADPNLLRQVWANLISNAVKYTRRKERAVIEITSTKNNGETVYRIKDNGTGFDMQYAHKLFGVFQRLHRQQDFEGTGVGLAIVHRIITRHGGKVWAEGKVDEGSAFYFTLPNETNT